MSCCAIFRRDLEGVTLVEEQAVPSLHTRCSQCYGVQTVQFLSLANSQTRIIEITASYLLSDVWRSQNHTTSDGNQQRSKGQGQGQDRYRDRNQDQDRERDHRRVLAMSIPCFRGSIFIASFLTYNCSNMTLLISNASPRHQFRQWAPPTPCPRLRY